MKNLKQILGLCEHKWINEKANRVERSGVLSGNINAIWDVFTLRCEKCGDIKVKKFSHS